MRSLSNLKVDCRSRTVLFYLMGQAFCLVKLMFDKNSSLAVLLLQVVEDGAEGKGLHLFSSP